MKHILPIIFILFMLCGTSWGGNTGTESIVTDKLSSGLIIIDFAHHEVHEGNAWYTSNSTTSASGSGMTFLLHTPDTYGSGGHGKYIHIVPQYRSSGESHIEGFFAPSVASAGTPVTSFNRFPDKGKTSGVAIYVNPTLTNTGEKVFEDHIGSGNKDEGTSRGTKEWVLGAGNYTFRLISEAASNDLTMKFQWYEEGPEH